MLAKPIWLTVDFGVSVELLAHLAGVAVKVLSGFVVLFALSVDYWLGFGA